MIEFTRLEIDIQYLFVRVMPPSARFLKNDSVLSSVMVPGNDYVVRVLAACGITPVQLLRYNFRGASGFYSSLVRVELCCGRLRLVA